MSRTLKSRIANLRRPPLVPSRLELLATSVVICSTPAISPAQRQTYTNTNAWFVFNADVALHEDWAILFDASSRRSGTFDGTMANFVRGGVAYQLVDHVRVAVGANWSRTYQYGEIPNEYPVTERRFWEQLSLSHEFGRLDVSHRYRLEQRFRGRRLDPDVDRIDYWERSSRFRYQARATLPLRGNATEPGEWYVTFADEIFIGIGRHVRNNIFDQNRATFGVGYRLTRHWRTELGFLEHTIFKPNGTDVERNHTFTMTLSYSRPPALRPIGDTPSK